MQMAAIADKCLKTDPKLRLNATILVKELQSVLKHSTLPPDAPAPPGRPRPIPPTPEVSHFSLFMCCCRRQA